MKSKSTAPDTDMAGVGHALVRAAAQARGLAEKTGTPFYVFRDGKIVDLNPQSSPAQRARRSGK